MFFKHTRHDCHCSPMPARFKRLADYNALRGTLTPAEFVFEMEELQQDFDWWAQSIRMAQR